MSDRKPIVIDAPSEAVLLAAEKVSVPYPVSDAEIADHGLVVRLVEPTPLERALEILAPKLKKIPGYIPTTRPEA